MKAKGACLASVSAWLIVLSHLPVVSSCSCAGTVDAAVQIGWACSARGMEEVRQFVQLREDDAYKVDQICKVVDIRQGPRSIASLVVATN
jgi:hypothetical protein